MTRTLPDTSRPSPPHAAFTLVELLTVIVIIAVLAALSLTTISYTQREAKVYRTRSTITKLDAAIGDIYERYDFRVIPDKDLPAGWDLDNGGSPLTGTALDARRNQMQLLALRDTIRLEMPQNWYEVMDIDNTSFGGSLSKDRIRGVDGGALQNYPATTFLHQRPPVHRFYQKAFEAAQTRLVASGLTAAQANELLLENGSAELLYLIIANLNPSALESFAAPEIGDTDEDGLLEFLDAWGNPIEFFRWAPGLPYSDRQPDIYTVSKAGGNVQWLIERNIDPLDAQRTGTWVPDRDGCALGAVPNADLILSTGWYLYPVVVSPGPDGVLGLRKGTDEPVPANKFASGTTPSYFNANETSYLHSFNPYDTINRDSDATTDGKDFRFLLGWPLDDGGACNDNIHNHQR